MNRPGLLATTLFASVATMAACATAQPNHYEGATPHYLKSTAEELIKLGVGTEGTGTGSAVNIANWFLSQTPHPRDTYEDFDEVFGIQREALLHVAANNPDKLQDYYEQIIKNWIAHDREEDPVKSKALVHDILRMQKEVLDDGYDGINKKPADYQETYADKQIYYGM